jgi:TnpA family transposase
LPSAESCWCVTQRGALDKARRKSYNRLDLIAAVWDEFVKIAASIRLEKVLQSMLSRNLAQPRVGGPCMKVIFTSGVCFRQYILIDFFTNTAFRAELQHVLNRGEAVHDVQRSIHIGQDSH